MKFSLSGLIFSALFIAVAAQAETNTNDASATLSITGNAFANEEALCVIHTTTSSVNLSGDVSNLIKQGDTADHLAFVPVRVTGNDACNSLLEQGRLAYRFMGTADSVKGTALANSSTGENAASGVAIGLFDYKGNPISINDTTITASHAAGQGVGFQVVKLDNQTVTAGKVHGELTIDIERL
ncbi:fimbrial protein [Cronobacter sakazakii]|uniref:fimbrial protein n=1 Tax=Cronobacter sakazakii TaxID=28141 RepID=UPI000A1E9919|nr:fimbrial protein [Cronobacter sakazakii]AZP31688.1 fimbrial protein [Cronobacter sakazakii]ELY2596018.1 fimbrial protein [Cronobacter sakazakii]ELY4032969.1 fimbrial protein [Cronobacter sakazakii]PUY24681.1 fimbrial protein [Cronobacter sakazakii]